MLSLSVCDVIALCHFKSSFDVFGPLLPFPQSFRDLVSDFLHDGPCYSLCLSVHSSLTQALHLFSSDWPISHDLFLHTPYIHDQFPSLHVGACPSTLRRSFFAAQPNWPQPRSFIQLLTLALCCPFRPIDHPSLCQKHLLHVLRADHSHIHRRLLFKKQCVPHCGHLMPRSRVSNMTAPAGPLTCLHVCASKICFLQAFCCSLFHRPIQVIHLQEKRQ